MISPTQTFWTGSGPPTAPPSCNCTPVTPNANLARGGDFGDFQPSNVYVHVQAKADLDLALSLAQDWEEPRSTGGSTISKYIVLRSRDQASITDMVKIGEISLESSPDDPSSFIGYSITLYLHPPAEAAKSAASLPGPAGSSAAAVKSNLGLPPLGGGVAAPASLSQADGGDAGTGIRTLYDGRYKISAKKEASGRNYVLPFPLDINANEPRPVLPTELEDLTVSSVLPGETYRYTVVAVNEFGASPQSEFGAHTGDLELEDYPILKAEYEGKPLGLKRAAPVHAAAEDSAGNRSMRAPRKSFRASPSGEGEANGAGSGVQAEANGDLDGGDAAAAAEKEKEKKRQGALEERKRKVKQLVSRGVMRVAAEKAAVVVHQNTSTFVGSVLGSCVQSQEYKDRESKAKRRAFLFGFNAWNESRKDTWVDRQSLLAPGITFPKVIDEEDELPPNAPEPLEPNTTVGVWIKSDTLEDERSKQAKMAMVEGLHEAMQAHLQSLGVDLLAEFERNSAPTTKKKRSSAPVVSFWSRLWRMVSRKTAGQGARIAAALQAPATNAYGEKGAEMGVGGAVDADDESAAGDDAGGDAEIPTCVLLIGGRPHHLEELVLCARKKIPLLIIEGTGGLADELAKKFLKWKEDPESLDNEPVMAEVVEDGELTFIDLDKDKVEDVVVNTRRFLNPVQNADDTRIILTDCWIRYALWHRSGEKQRLIGRALNFFIQLFGLLSIVTVVLDAFFQTSNCTGATPAVPGVLGYCINGSDWRQYKIDVFLSTLSVLWPIVLTALLSISSRLSATSKFAGLTVSAEFIKAELMKFRTKAGLDYRDKNGPLKLAEKVKGISTRLMQGEINSSSLDSTAKKIVRVDKRNKQPFIIFPETDDRGLARLQMLASEEGEPEASKEKAGFSDVRAMEWIHPEDNGFAQLEPDQYIKLRVQPKIRRFRKESKELSLWLKFLQIVSYLVGGLGAVLGALNFRIWIALTTGAVSVLTAFQELEKLEMRLMRMNMAITELNNLLVWWAALGRGDKLKRANVDKLVLQAEAAILSEVGWMAPIANESDDKEEEGKHGAKRKGGKGGKGADKKGKGKKDGSSSDEGENSKK
eukprot:tig00000403_g268.t1